MKPVVCNFFHKLSLLLSLPFCVSAHEFSAKISYLQPCHSCPCPFKNFMAAQQRGRWGSGDMGSGGRQGRGAEPVQKGTGVSRATFTTTTHLSLWLPTQEGLAAAAAALAGGVGSGGRVLLIILAARICLALAFVRLISS